jgi:hypothetical protein
VQIDSLTPVAAQHPQIDFLRVADNRPPRFDPSSNAANDPVVIQGNIGEALSVNMNTWFNDLEDHQMTFSGNGIPTSLSLGNRTGELSGTPDALDAAASPIDFTVVAFDGLESRTGYFQLQVGAGSDTPVAADDGPFAIAEGATLNDGSSVLDNDSDPNGDPLTAVLESGPASASSFTLNADGTFVYVHDGVSAAAADSFTYRASDGTLQSNVATVTINIAVVDDPPVITLMGSATMALTIGDAYTDPGYTATDDEDGDITASVVVGGDAVDTSTAGTYVVTYNVTDSGGNAATEVTRTVTVSAAPPPPPPPPPPSGGGGGMTGLWEMIALFAGGIVTLARRRRETRR